MSSVLWPFWRRKPQSRFQDPDGRTTANANANANAPIGRGPPPAPPRASPTTASTARPRPAAASLATPECPGRLPCQHPPHGCADPDSLTTPNPIPPSFYSTQTPALDQTADRQPRPHSQQPVCPPASSQPAAEPAVAAAAALNATQPSALGQVYKPSLLQSPFRRRPSATSDPASRVQRLPAARLWNPTNSTPRIPQPRKRRPSSPPIPTLPLKHPALDTLLDIPDSVATAAGDYPLLTVSEQRRSRYSQSARASFQIELGATSDHRIGLPSSVRASHEGNRPAHRTSTSSRPRAEKVNDRQPEQTTILRHSAKSKGEQKVTMAPENDDARRPYSRDLESGPDVMDPRVSNVSAADGIGPALSSSNSSIMGEDVQPDAGEEWGPQHPCFPHLNPHVPLDSVEHATTRIIRVKRDWLVAGDLAPTFSNLYPEILDPAGISEREFRRVIEKLNGELIPLFDPFTFRNVLDSVLGLVTGWLWDDFGLTAAKSRLNNLEQWIEKWNQEMEKTMASEEGTIPPKLISLRQTGYMSLDIQIPDPEIAPAPSTIGAGAGAGESRTALPMEPAPAITA
ncbi:Golgin subfamily A member 7/ERF4 [Metarhizium album ARSEF 1941]|uniref:Ras modification protein ERF4 n=1 Tax=Metarhizium album (strain ARSEF 1941) TaxID=1081103 RepID=A0A0B2X2M4_METAS|nr:Golgin subfamily A member 7/ERF4 [Metarhizium album ARSEF 1941]KHN99515.1 Golgin subfamily A member 7/ERF4 [Metarhizium album ARSEF 1941]